MSDEEPLRIGILGCGGFAGAHARRYREMDEVRIVALCDVEPGHIDKLVERRLDGYAPAPTRFTEPERMFADAGLDGVSILSPHVLHAEHALMAVEAGCHALVEKPMVTAPADGERLRAAARAAGLHVLPGYNPVYQEPVRWLRRAVAEGRFGELHLVTAWLAQNWREPTAGSWRQDPAVSGGGQSIDSGSHLLAGLCFCIGGLPERVYARYENRGAAVDVDSAMLLDFPGGLHAAVSIGGQTDTNGSGAAFVFDRGRVEINLWGGRSLVVEGTDPGDDPPPTEPAEVSSNRCFVDAVRGTAEPPIDVAFGCGQARLHAALQASAREGRPVGLEA